MGLIVLNLQDGFDNYMELLFVKDLKRVSRVISAIERRETGKTYLFSFKVFYLFRCWEGLGAGGEGDDRG